MRSMSTMPESLPQFDFIGICFLQEALDANSDSLRLSGQGPPLVGEYRAVYQGLFSRALSCGLS